MGERVTFPSNGHSGEGYLAAPAGGRGPAVVVIQEWWGVVPHIQDVVERFAAEGFLAIAPDLYHGKTTTSPDDAAKLLMELDVERAEREIAGAGSYLLSRPECSSSKFGVIGFCMGGALAQYAATKSAKVAATVSFYGGFKKVQCDWKNLSGPLMLMYGENDQGVPPAGGRELESQLKALGKSVELHVYPGAGHAFFNDARPEAYDKPAAEDAWTRTLEFFRKNIR
jgi:carboxymethylenebutenolidase